MGGIHQCFQDNSLEVDNLVELSRNDGTSASGGVSGNESHLIYGSIQKLANAQIENEDDAEKALQLSSALTQALLAYRIKKVSSANNPISSLLNTLHAVRATPTQYPQQQQQQNPNLHAGQH